MMNEIDLSHAFGDLDQAERVLLNIKKSMLADQKQAQALEEQTLIRVLMQMIGKISKRSEGANNV
ncbi:hypothetical protein [uncultured Bartonella sp.]|uniref:hypothetical protein n=1 Tax=uncultured Bartonella sp. TaxID=104108 RepID=UPI0025F89CBE|nr:hypothetical protein [uncultured Bartonella sp.]